MGTGMSSQSKGIELNLAKRGSEENVRGPVIWRRTRGLKNLRAQSVKNV